MKRILVWLSWWVDSAVAAYLLMQQGFDVTGGFMVNYTTEDETCTTKEDLAEAQKVADYLWIKLYIFDYQQEYHNRIITYIVESYKNGLTPNPDVLCNSEIKFNVFLDEWIALGFDAIATGHYAQIKKNDPTSWELMYDNPDYFEGETIQEIAPTEQKTTIDNDYKQAENATKWQKQTSDTWKNILNFATYSLYKWIDTSKDQSYFLAWLNQYQLSKAIFPLWWLKKSEVRQIAKKAWLPNADRKDSQGICFIGKVPMREFLQQYIPEKKGPIVDMTGKKLGEHNGVRWYTIWQRQWLGISAPRPLFVLKKDIVTNTLVVGYADTDELCSSEISVSNRHWIGEPYNFPRAWGAKIRYRQADQHVTLQIDENQHVHAQFEQPQRAVASGQVLVAYDEDKVIWSGIIV